MLGRLWSWPRRLRQALRPMRERGLGWAAALLLQVPAAFVLRGWRVVAQPLVGRGPWRWWNARRWRAFQARLPASHQPRFVVIVMPNALHYLLPCLGLLDGRAQVVLLANGARRWERELLRERFPEWPMLALRTLPRVSVAHGDVISLLLAEHAGDFGIVDHDCYVFDERLFTQMRPAADEAMLAFFGEDSRTVALRFPLTYLLYFHAEVLRRMMVRYRVDARLYRRTPPLARSAMLGLGLAPGRHLKWYHGFHDTLHVLLGVCWSEGLRVRWLESDAAVPALHVGGTSVGSHHTKDLWALYIHLRFLDLLDDPCLRERYAFLTAPLRSAAEVVPRVRPGDEAWQALPVVDDLIERLGATLVDPAGRRRGRRVSPVGA